MKFFEGLPFPGGYSTSAFTGTPDMICLRYFFRVAFDVFTRSLPVNLFELFGVSLSSFAFVFRRPLSVASIPLTQHFLKPNWISLPPLATMLPVFFGVSLPPFVGLGFGANLTLICKTIFSMFVLIELAKGLPFPALIALFFGYNCVHQNCLSGHAPGCSSTAGATSLFYHTSSLYLPAAPTAQVDAQGAP